MKDTRSISPLDELNDTSKLKFKYKNKYW